MIHHRQQNIRKIRRNAFTLLQVLVTVAVISVLAALAFGRLSQGRALARQATCDARLKAIALALDAYRQTEKQFPVSLQELVAQNLVDASMLRCPSDPDSNSGGYDTYYILRQARGDIERPILVCPFHEDRNSATRQPGVQAFVGRYTRQYPTMYATLRSVNNATVQQPGQDAIAGADGMILRGGDRVRTGPLGSAVIHFTDGSTATLKGNCDLTVLQSFLDSQVTGSPLYTLVRQLAGTAVYYVHHGSKFDVATPTATAGARGTRFRVTITTSPASTHQSSAPATELEVYEGRVVFNNARHSVTATPGNILEGLRDILLKLL